MGITSFLAQKSAHSLILKSLLRSRGGLTRQDGRPSASEPSWRMIVSLDFQDTWYHAHG
jgi:hypothetical protein